MGSTTTVSQTLTFHFGNKVVYSDGQEGILTRLIFDAQSQRLTHLAVKQGHFFGKTHYIPFETVTQANADGVLLKSTYAEGVAAPTAEGPGVALDTHTQVKGNVESKAGTLALVAVLPQSGELAYIVTRNLLEGRDTMLEASHVTALSPGQVIVTADEAFLQSLPPYRSDASLQRDVEQIVFDLPFLHVDLKAMYLRVRDSVLYMEGNISSALRGELTSDQVVGVKGLREVKNNLVADDTLAAEIAMALGKDEITREQPIGVYPQLGVVRLSGSVHSEAQKHAALEIARKFNGVREVVDNLQIDPSTAMLYVMSAPEGGEAKDIPPGKFTRHTN